MPARKNLVGCTDCHDKWRIILAEQSNTNNMKTESEKQVATPAEQVAKIGRIDVNKVIEDRRKAIESGKTVNK